MVRWGTVMPLVRDLETDWGNNEGYTIAMWFWKVFIDMSLKRISVVCIRVSRWEISTFAVEVFVWNIILWYLYRSINIQIMKTFYFVPGWEYTGVTARNFLITHIAKLFYFILSQPKDTTKNHSHVNLSYYFTYFPY